MRFRSQTILIWLLLVSLPVGCQHGSGLGAVDVAPQSAAPAPAGSELRFMGQPAAADFTGLRDAGVGVVINLRGDAETDWDEAAAARAAGLDYYRVPVSRSGPSFDPQAIDSITRIIGQYRDSEVLLHCSSGNRVAAWYAIYLVEQHGSSIDAALAQARDRGLTSAALERRVRHYLSDRPTP